MKYKLGDIIYHYDQFVKAYILGSIVSKEGIYWKILCINVDYLVENNSRNFYAFGKSFYVKESEISNRQPKNIELYKLLYV